jgi:hypothetical protein
MFSRRSKKGDHVPPPQSKQPAKPVKQEAKQPEKKKKKEKDPSFTARPRTKKPYPTPTQKKRKRKLQKEARRITRQRAA